MKGILLSIHRSWEKERHFHHPDHLNGCKCAKDRSRFSYLQVAAWKEARVWVLPCGVSISLMVKGSWWEGGQNEPQLERFILTHVGSKTFPLLLTYWSTCVDDLISWRAGTTFSTKDNCLLNGSRVLGGTGGGAGPGGGFTLVGGSGAGRTGTSLDFQGWSLKGGPAPSGAMYPSKVPHLGRAL